MHGSFRLTSLRNTFMTSHENGASLNADYIEKILHTVLFI